MAVAGEGWDIGRGREAMEAGVDVVIFSRG